MIKTVDQIYVFVAQNRFWGKTSPTGFFIYNLLFSVTDAKDNQAGVFSLL